MLLQELYKPKIDPRAAKAVTSYIRYNPPAKMWHQKNMQKLELNAVLEQYGWIPLNSGAYSSVYKKAGKNYVMKVNREQDPGYAHYVNLIHKYPNKHFPVISDLKRLPIGSKELVYVYLIEKLHEVRWSEEISRTERNISFVVENYPEESIMEMYNDDLPRCFTEDPSLLKAAMTLGLYKGNSSVDLHSDNFMQRSDGTLVIIDPFVLRN